MLSQTVEYALRAVVFLADQGERFTNRRTVSERTDVPLEYLAKVLNVLSQAGIVQAARGPGGGYALKRPPEHINVLHIVNAIEPVKRIRRCPLGRDEHIRLCPLHARLDEAAAMAEKAFASTLVSELMRRKPAVKDRCTFPRTAKQRNKMEP